MTQTAPMGPQPTTTSPSRRRSRGGAARRSRARNHRRLRLLYFGLASLWGFLAGTGAVLGALSASGHAVRMSSTIGGALIVAALAALIGAAVAARAYREAVRRAG